MMKVSISVFRTTAARAACLALLALAAGCGPGKPKIPALGTQDADKFLFNRGMEELNKKHWYSANEYFKRLIESYPQSDKRQDAKIGLGDSMLGLKSASADILAINEFREFLQYYPLNPKADYALYRICQAEYRQVLIPERDQSATVEAMKDIDTFLERYPTVEQSKYRPEVEKLKRAAQDRLSDKEFLVGLYYFRAGKGVIGGALNRFTYLLQHDPDYTRRDQVYYYLAESMMRLSRANGPQALPYFDKIVQEFPKSKFYRQAQLRVAELKPPK
jgi:outer membrane protein assembly factor BamD